MKALTSLMDKSNRKINVAEITYKSSVRYGLMPRNSPSSLTMRSSIILIGIGSGKKRDLRIKKIPLLGQRQVSSLHFTT